MSTQAPVVGAFKPHPVVLFAMLVWHRWRMGWWYALKVQADAMYDLHREGWESAQHALYPRPPMTDEEEEAVIKRFRRGS